MDEDNSQATRQLEYMALFMLCMLACIVGLFTIAFAADYRSNHPKPTDYKVYHIPHGTAYCGQAWADKCGFNLSHCTDEHEYRCLQNVMWDGSKP